MTDGLRTWELVGQDGGTPLIGGPDLVPDETVCVIEQSSQAKMLTPTVPLLCAIGSIARHAEEAISGEGSHFDLAAIKALLADPAVVEWMGEMDRAALLPALR